MSNGLTTSRNLGFVNSNSAMRATTWYILNGGLLILMGNLAPKMFKDLQSLGNVDPAQVSTFSLFLNSHP